MKKITSFLFILYYTSSILACQQIQQVPFTPDYWEFNNSVYITEMYMGRESIKLSNGIISVSGVDFQNGIIEVDVNFPLERFFPTVHFRMQDSENTEHFYVRPHQSGNPDATQYTPVFNGESGWQLYHGEGYSQAVNLEPNTWHHIKINVLDNQADIYFNDMKIPLIKVTDLKLGNISGKIGLTTNSPVHFANFKYSLEEPILVDREPKETDSLSGLITDWYVSGIVTDELYQDKSELNLQDVFWSLQPTESSGIINLARFVKRGDNKNTILTKLDITSEESTQKELIFGYNDFVWIYVNGQPIYNGSNDFRSRDYRYLGTIGFFDSIYLPLNQGENEIVFVVSENFGGWGLKARIPNQNGIEINKK